MSRSKIEGDIDADANQSGDPSSSELEGFVEFSVPLAAVVARLRGKRIVKVLRGPQREEDRQTPL
ncbi:hypothetical protein ASF69_04505 [Rhizobium sp. Leaf311]|nr:hypothetical protein ASF69_04505 [Rhizobium sp. Leaf311]